jgi:uncharacterized membrane protein
MENKIRTFLLLLSSLVASLVFGALVAYVAMEALPCHWFGTGFEGACAYGVLYTSLGIGLVSVLLMFAWFCYRLIQSSKNRVSRADDP